MLDRRPRRACHERQSVEGEPRRPLRGCRRCRHA
jgi:hypothetical protein